MKLIIITYEQRLTIDDLAAFNISDCVDHLCEYGSGKLIDVKIEETDED